MITFNVGKDGKCDSLVLTQGGVDQTARRQKEPADMIPPLVGTYELPGGKVFTVENNEGKLMIALTGQGFNQVYPRSTTEWFYKVVDTKITFNLDKNGKCDSLDLIQEGIRHTAKRKTHQPIGSKMSDSWFTATIIASDIFCYAIYLTSTAWLEHRERMAMIEKGLPPDSWNRPQSHLE